MSNSGVASSTFVHIDYRIKSSLGMTKKKKKRQLLLGDFLVKLPTLDLLAEEKNPVLP